jgi:CubicO group peptidase (beta-lactamase class C family)
MRANVLRVTLAGSSRGAGDPEDRIPGAVLLIGHKGQIVHRKAYGKRALVPAAEPMTVDTIFDLASLTKVVATTTSSLMKLFEEGKFRLNDRVTQYLPEFRKAKARSPSATCSPTFRACPRTWR